jgi:hypothetical protein
VVLNNLEQEKPVWLPAAPGGSIYHSTCCAVVSAVVSAGYLCCAVLCRFTRDAALLQLVGEVLLPTASQQPHKLNRWLVGKDAFALAEPETAEVLIDTIRSLVSGDRFAADQHALRSAPTEVDVAGALQLPQLWESDLQLAT